MYLYHRFVLYLYQSILYVLTTVWCEIMVDSESAMSSAALDPEETVLSPAGSPLVLHDPEVLPPFRTVTYCSHCVVVSVLAVGIRRFLAAIGVVEYAVAVGGGGSNRRNMGGHVSLAGIPGDVVAGDAGDGVVAAVVVVAVVVCGGVGAAVLLLQAATVLADDRLHVPVGPPTFTSVCGEAVDEVLFGKVSDDAGLLCEAGLDGGNGGECRTTAALPLVLDR